MFVLQAHAFILREKTAHSEFGTRTITELSLFDILCVLAWHLIQASKLPHKESLILQNLDQHAKYVRHTVIPGVHPEMIRQIYYIPDNDMIISSCANPNKSIIISHIQSLKNSYVFKIDKVNFSSFFFLWWMNNNQQ